MTTEKFYIGLIVEGEYPDGLVDWCNSQETPTTIEEIEPKEDGTRRFKVIEVVQPIILLTEEQFLNNFFEIPSYGWYRKRPKGYADAITSLNTAFNMVQAIGFLPENTLIFYTKPDFTDETQCTEEWLISNQFKNEYMNKDVFMDFFSLAVQAWNIQEHM